MLLAPLATSDGMTRVNRPKVTVVTVGDGCVALSVAGTPVTGMGVGDSVAGIKTLVGELVAVAAGVQAESKSAPARRVVSSFGKNPNSF